jgi:hypothetical protein
VDGLSTLKRALVFVMSAVQTAAAVRMRITQSSRMTAYLACGRAFLK